MFWRIGATTGHEPRLQAGNAKGHPRSMSALLNSAGSRLARFLSRPRAEATAPRFTNIAQLATVLQPADVLLVEGNSMISSAIKYLTQSTWSHAAIFIGLEPNGGTDTDAETFIEADMVEGVRRTSLSTYAGLRTRVCRPVGLTAEDRQRVIDYVATRVGHQYDLRNVVDLARYLFPTPPVPQRFRRRMISLGSGDPTRAICSTLIAQAFQSVKYPILPHLSQRDAARPDCPDCLEEVLHIRHHSLFAPRDFDLSPYFEIVKPLLDREFDYRSLIWGDADTVDAVA